MKKILLFAVLLLTLTLLPTVPIVAEKPSHPPGQGKPPREERYYNVTFTGDIIAGPLELMSQSARGKGGKHLALLTPQGEDTILTFVGDVWKDWAGTTHDDGNIRLSINLKFNEVGIIYFFDYEHGPLDFWRLKSTDGRIHTIGEWISDEGIARFDGDPFEIWKYSAQGDITRLDLTFNVTIKPKP